MQRFPTPPVPGIPPPALYKVDPGIAVPTAPAGQPVPQPPIDFHPVRILFFSHSFVVIVIRVHWLYQILSNLTETLTRFRWKSDMEQLVFLRHN